MRKNWTLTTLREGKPAVGTWLQLHSPPAARLLAAQGLFQWLLVDYEHTPVDPSTASVIFSSISDVSGGRVTPLARVAVGSIDRVKMALDAGAQGIIVPMIHNAEEVRSAVRYARFPPDGERGAGGLAPHLGFGVSRPEYLRRANAEILVGIQIETREALEDIDRILDVPGVDLCFIGPNDLHMALGFPPAFWSGEPRFLEAVSRVKAACARRGIPLGTLNRDAAAARTRLDEGFSFLGLGSDLHFLLTFAGMQAGELLGIPEPPSWCDRVSFES